MNYYRRYIGDYQRDTQSLRATEHGVYTLLLDTYYSTDGDIPTDYAELYVTCRAFEDFERDAVRKVSDKFFPINGDGKRHNKRADKELAVALPAIEAMRESGRQGAAKRWGGDRAPYRVGNGVADGVAIEPPTTNHQPPAFNLNPSTASTKPPDKVKNSTRGSRLDTETLPYDWRKWALEHRPDLDAETVFEGFRDYWIAAAGGKGVKLDWFATWRNWCRNQGARPGMGKSKTSGNHQALEEFAAKMRAEHALQNNEEKDITP